MTRVWLFATVSAALLAAQDTSTPRPELKERKPAAEKYQEPPEEDEPSKPKEYVFNPLQAANELKIGIYYFKKGSYRAAARRFQEAGKWNPGFAEAYLRLGEAEEKLKDSEAARAAYARYLELEPDAKNAAEIQRKLARTSKR